MSRGRAIWLTARREIQERLRSRAFLVGTGVQLLIVVAVVIIAGVAGGDDTDKVDVGYVGTEAETALDTAARLQGSFQIELTPREYPDEAAARTAVEGDEADAAVAGDSLITSSDPPQTLTSLLQTASGQARGSASLRSDGLDDEQIAAGLRPPALTVEEVGDEGAGKGVAFIGSLLLYVALLSFGIVVASAVVTEKQTRVVEVILSSIRSINLLSGKVVGIGLLGIAQVLLIAIVGVAAALITGSVDLPETTAESVILVLVYFLLGYLLYACAFAVSGAIVSRQEDLQSSSAPLSIILLAGYLVGISTIDTPDSSLVVLCTALPPVAPMVVPGRAAQGALPGWELALSLVLMVAATVLLIWLAARIYDRAVLRMGAPIKFGQALRLARRGE